LLTSDVLKRLAALNEDAYGDWTNGDLKRVMEAEGEEPKKSHGRMVIHKDHVLRAIANRDADGSASASN
jgi:S-DNA-T family DNA segregation ATPase FtsK/SpoIIIE